MLSFGVRFMPQQKQWGLLLIAKRLKILCGAWHVRGLFALASFPLFLYELSK
jgi:hypothetical protein